MSQDVDVASRAHAIWVVRDFLVEEFLARLHLLREEPSVILRLELVRLYVAQALILYIVLSPILKDLPMELLRVKPGLAIKDIVPQIELIERLHYVIFPGNCLALLPGTVVVLGLACVADILPIFEDHDVVEIHATVLKLLLRDFFVVAVYFFYSFLVLQVHILHILMNVMARLHDAKQILEVLYSFAIGLLRGHLHYQKRLFQK